MVIRKIPNITNLASTTGLTAVENKIPNVTNLVKKSDYRTKINGIEKKITDHDHDKSITTPEFEQEDKAAYTPKKCGKFIYCL